MNVTVSADGTTLPGLVGLPAGTEPAGAPSWVIFAHGSGSSRLSPRNLLVADVLHRAGHATLLFDLLTPAEENRDRHSGQHRFDIGLLARRLTGAVDWLIGPNGPAAGRSPGIGLFGASTGAEAALVTAATRTELIGAVVSRGGRPDLAGDALGRVRAPTLLIVGSLDTQVIELNRHAEAALAAPVHELAIVPGATHLFEEPGTLEEVADLAAAWFDQHLRPAPRVDR